jgi:hypothetical protein
MDTNYFKYFIVIMLLIYSTLSVLDAHSTTLGINEGYSEMNPLVNKLINMFGLYVVYPIQFLDYGAVMVRHVGRRGKTYHLKIQFQPKPS